MKRWWVSGILMLCLFAGAAPGQAEKDYDGAQYRRYRGDSSLRLRLGLFTPEGDSDYWRDKDNDFTGAATSDLEDVSGGIDYTFNLGGHLDLMVSGSWYESQQDMSYRDFEDNFGDPITHTGTLEIAPFTAGVVVRLAPEAAPIIPYVGAGGGIYAWRLEESGDFIDFDVPSRPIFDATLASEGVALGYYGLAGIEVPVSSSFSLFAEGRWHRADDDLSEDFEGFGKLDLSGREVHGGIAFRF